MAFPTKSGSRHCPVEGYSGQAAMQTAVRMHFWNWHIRYTVVILEEGNLPHPWCPLYNMMMLWRSLKGSHKNTAQYKKGAEWKRRSLVEDEAREETSREFSAYRRTLEMVLSFKYLGRVILVLDDEWPALIQNLTKARAV